MVNSLRCRTLLLFQWLTRSWRYNLEVWSARQFHGAQESMQREPEYGPRLSAAEYERQIINLYRNLPPLPSSAQDREVRRRELELAIDHRLGRGFPEERRSALWAVQQRIEKKRLRLGIKYLLRRLAAKVFVRDAQLLAGYAAEEYAKVLSPSELKSFLDLKENERPALPVDLEHLHKIHK